MSLIINSILILVLVNSMVIDISAFIIPKIKEDDYEFNNKFNSNIGISK
nr:MAG TPA: hypothetical protein [Caudoviricetes sp.]